MTDQSQPLAVIGTRRTMKELVDGTIRVQIDIDPQYKKAFLERFELDKAVALVQVNLSGSSNGRTPDFDSGNAGSSPAPEAKPYGKQAAELYRLGFFLNPKVLEAIGTDAEYLAWVRAQPCAVTGKFDYTKDEATGETRMACEASHVDRINLGRGMNEKPPYAAIPLTHHWHEKRHRVGVSVFADGDPAKGKQWEEKQRARFVVQWASERLAQTLHAESMGYVAPDSMCAWAEEHELLNALPKIYRDDRT